MALKFLIAAGIIAAVWAIAFRASARSGAAAAKSAPARAPRKPVEDLSKCASCGAWRAPGRPCPCGSGA